MMSVACEGLAFACGDNQSVSCNSIVPEITLKKKHQIIECYLVREGVERDEWRTVCAKTNENEADLLTKTLPSGEKRNNFVRKVFHHIFRSEERRNL